VLLFPANSSFASHSVKDTLTIQTMWVTGNKSCYYNDERRMNEWNDEIIKKYLSLYGLRFYTYDPVCLTDWEYENYEPHDYTDLLIVIYNKNVGRDELHSRNIGGFFSWGSSDTKNELRIEVCECPNFDYNEDVWVLSHELAHFALFYLGYPGDVFADWVHDIQSKYYAYCPDGDTTSISCNGLWQKIDGYTRNYKVMKVYPGTFGIVPPQAKFVNVQQDVIPRTSSIQQTFDDKVLSDSEISKILGRISSAWSTISGLQQGLGQSSDAISSGFSKYESSKALEHVQKAFSIYSELSNHLNEQNDKVDETKSSLDALIRDNTTALWHKDSFDIFSSILNSVDFQLVQIGSKMKYISQELEYAQQAEDEYQSQKQKDEQVCFLFWCS